MLTEKAKHKVKVLVFWEKHGLQATYDFSDSELKCFELMAKLGKNK